MPNAPWLDVATLARGKGEWRGSVPLEAFARLATLVPAESGEVQVSLAFDVDEDGRPRVRGDCCFVARVNCRRCLHEASLPVECEVNLRVVATEGEASALAPTADAVVCERFAELPALVEDDLLLAVPDLACDDPEQCPHRGELAAWLDVAHERTEAALKGPFQALGEMTADRRRQEEDED